MAQILRFALPSAFNGRRGLVTFGVGTPAVPVPGILYTALPSAITEGGANQTLSFRLMTQPTSGVVVTVASGDTSALATTGGSFVSFTTSNWDTAQSITLTAPADSDIVDETVTVTLTGTSSDSDYSGELSTFTVTVTDAGGPQMWWWTGITPGTTAPADGAGNITGITVGNAIPATLWLTLDSNPSASVNVSLAEDEAEITVSKNNLGVYRGNSQNNPNWNMRAGGHSFTVVATSAAVSGSTHLITATASSSDSAWDGVTSTFTVTVS